MEYIQRGAPAATEDVVHRLDKVDKRQGLTSLRFVSAQHVPYAMLLYERFLGRPFASHRDAVSELVGNIMEDAIEALLRRARIGFRRTTTGLAVPGFKKAPDFFVPDEIHPAVLIEAKITSDGGTARDKFDRLRTLCGMRDDAMRKGQHSFEVVACIDGRGFGVRKADMRDLLVLTNDKVFTLNSLDQLIPHTRLRDFLPITPPGH